MATTFTYADDIAPMKGDYFGRPISTRMSQYLYEQYDRPMMQMQAEGNKLRAQQLAFERAELELERVREENRRQQDEADAIARVSQDLTMGLSSDMDPTDQIGFINKTRQDTFAQSPRLAGSPLFKSLFDSATKSALGSQQQQNINVPQMQQTAGLGDVEATERLADADGVRTRTELGIIETAKSQREANKARAQSGRAKAFGAELKTSLSEVKNFGSVVEARPQSGDDEQSFQPVDKFQMTKDENQQMMGIVNKFLTPEDQKKYKENAAAQEEGTGGFFDDESRKNFLINKLRDRAVDVLAEAPESEAERLSTS